jgi:hypothetical protein
MRHTNAIRDLLERFNRLEKLHNQYVAEARGIRHTLNGIMIRLANFEGLLSMCDDTKCHCPTFERR